MAFYQANQMDKGKWEKDAIISDTTKKDRDRTIADIKSILRLTKIEDKYTLKFCIQEVLDKRKVGGGVVLFTDN